MSKLILGVDPGLSGGLGLLDADAKFIGAWPIVCTQRSRSAREMDAGWFAGRLRGSIFGGMEGDTPIGVVVVERQRPFPGQGVSSVFSLGDSVGMIRGVCAALGVELHYAEPQTWKKFYGLKGVKKDPRLAKEMARAQAIRFYPRAPLTRKKEEGVAEALLIARWFALQGHGSE